MTAPDILSEVGPVFEEIFPADEETSVAGPAEVGGTSAR
jgi:hypothetical protein